MDRPDTNSNLRQISAGNLQVWAIDTHNRLYRRRDIVSILPEGTMWELVDEHVLHVSVGKHDQVGNRYYALLRSHQQSFRLKLKHLK